LQDEVVRGAYEHRNEMSKEVCTLVSEAKRKKKKVEQLADAVMFCDECGKLRLCYRLYPVNLIHTEGAERRICVECVIETAESFRYLDNTTSVRARIREIGEEEK